MSDENTGEVSSTKAVSGVVVVATKDGNSIESNPIEFVEITKPVFSQASAHWGTPITFPAVAGYTYTFKQEKTGVTLSEATGNRKQVTATQSAQNVIIVVTDNGLSVDSDPIEFTRIQGNTLSFANENVDKALGSSGEATHTQAATSDGTVTEDDREIVYKLINRRGRGATIDSSSGKVTLTRESSSSSISIIAELPQDEKYTRSIAVYYIEVGPLKPVAPALNKDTATWGEVITFPIQPHHTYEVYGNINNVVTLTIDGTTGRLTATKSIKNEELFIVARLGANTVGVPFEFTRIPGNTLSFSISERVEASISVGLTQTATKSGAVAGDTRNIKYSISPADRGVTIDSSSGEVTIARDTDPVGQYTITAELQQNAKYERSTATYSLTVQ